LKLRKSKEQRDAERRARKAVWAEEDAAIKREAQAQLPPLFSEAAVGGRCPKCGGASFESGRTNAAGAFLVGGLAGVAAAHSLAGRGVLCVTCGMEFGKG
jgi:membrane protein involved in colicin uptake